MTYSACAPTPLSTCVSLLATFARRTGFAAAIASILGGAIANAQETSVGRATITGVVTEVNSGAPVSDVTVSIPGTTYRATTDEQGRYTLRNVPFGNQTIDAKRVGYSPAHADNVAVNRANFTYNITISQAALSLAAVTSSATVDPTSGIRSPFAVSKVTADALPVPSTGLGSNLAGKVAGVQVLAPSGSTNGEEPWIQMRSMQSPGNRASSPLIIVDGVPLNMVRQTMFTGRGLSGGPGIIVPVGDVVPVRSSDLEGLDIESIEVIKGAAAAALYGSQASAGVISIKTKRGDAIGLGARQLEVRSSYGVDRIAKMPEMRLHNYFRINPQGQWIDAAGNVVPRQNRIVDPDLMIDNEFAPGTIHNPARQAFVPNRTASTTIRASQNSPTSNYQLSYTRTRQPGTLRDAAGSTNQSARMNIDHQLKENLRVSVGGNYSNVVNIPTVINFNTLFAFDPDIDLLAPGTLRGTKYVISPDSANPTVLNPLYSQSISGNEDKRNSTQLSANLSSRPFNWLTLVGNLGFNRQEGLRQAFTPPGLPSDEAGGITTGSLSYTDQTGQGVAASGSATVLRDVGDLTVRLTGQLEATHRKFLEINGTGTIFSTVGAQTLTAAQTQTTYSISTEAAVNSGFGSLALDYAGKYIGDFLFRRESSSLFGPKNRYHNYSRASGAWLVSRESWWPSALRNLTLAKVRYSYGTSGNEPDFTDQFESVVLNTTGFVRARLGNSALVPETKAEHEMGADFIWKNRVSLSLTYSKATTKNGIFEVEAPDVSGFNTYTRNAGIAHGNAFEASLEGQLIRTKNFGWSSTLNVDRARSVIDTYGRSCYNEAPQFVRICDGVPPTQYWGQVIMRDVSQLPKSRSGTPSAWEVNDEGFLVPVGAGNHWYEGMKKKLWGTQVIIDGITYNWGVPQAQFSDSSQSTNYAPIGDWEPKFNFGYANRFVYKSLQLNVLFSGSVGGQIINGYLARLENSLIGPTVDQAGKPDSLKKPYLYYQGLAGGGKTSGFPGMNNDVYVTSGSYVKLAEATVSYSFNSRRFPILNRIGAENLSVELNGTNLFRFDNGYKGLDQEGYYTLSNQQRIKYDALRYPQARRFTTSVAVIF